MSVSEKRGLVNGGELEKEEITRFMSEDKPIDLKAPPSRQSPHHSQMHNNQNMIFIKILIQPGKGIKKVIGNEGALTLPTTYDNHPIQLT